MWLVGDVGGQHALGVGVERDEAVEDGVEAVAGQRLRPSEIETFPALVAESFDGSFEVGDAVFEAVDPLFGPLAFADRVAPSLLFGVELSFEVVVLGFEVGDSLLQPRTPQQPVEHHRRRGGGGLKLRGRRFARSR